MILLQHLATADAKILALIGSGHQAYSHAQLLKCVKNFTEVRIWSRNIENAKKLANKINGKAFDSVEEAVKDADVIVTVTLSKEPVVFGKWTKSDCLINSKFEASLTVATSIAKLYFHFLLHF